MCMFIAPFGMLIAKWATLVSFVDTKQVALILLLVFGSAATFMFWGKWLGKLAGIAGNPPNQEVTVHKSEWVSIRLMAVLLIACCVGLPFISQYVVEPYITGVFGGFTVGISLDNLILASVVVIFIVVILFAGLGRGKARNVDVYMSGISVNNPARTFTNSLSKETEATARNWYMEQYFGEAAVSPIGTICSALIIVLAFVVAVVMFVGLF